MSLQPSTYIGDQTQQLVNVNDTGATPVNRRSDQFQEVHYKLEMVLAHADVKVTHLQVWDVRSPNLVARFDQHLRRCPGQPPVDSWIDVDGLDAHNSEEQIAKRGFQLRPGASSMGFSTGQVNIAKPPEDGRSSGLNRFLLAEVCTGRSYPKVDPNGKNIIPPGYDSLYLYDGDNNNKESIGMGSIGSGNLPNKSDYQHDYVLTDMTQVSPQFVVHFTVAAVTDHDRARNAKAKEAHHNSQGADVMGDILDLLDRKLHWSQESVRNKFHSVNALQNELSQASQEYNKSLDASHQQDERLEACRAQLASRRTTINEKLTEVQKNSALVEEQLYTMLQDALFQLQDETQRKLNVLLGEELEIRRRVAHIDWSEECLSRFRTELGPPDFVHAWRNHRSVRKSLYRYRDIGTSVLDRVFADIRVAGGVQIVTERGPTSAVANGDIETNESVHTGSMMNDFRQEVFKTSSPIKNMNNNNNNNNEMNGTNSLASSIRGEIATGRSRQAPNAYANSPTVTGLGLPSSSLRPPSSSSALRGPYEDNSDGLNGTSSTEDMQDEWSQYMRKDWGLPSPPQKGTNSTSPNNNTNTTTTNSNNNYSNSNNNNLINDINDINNDNNDNNDIGGDYMSNDTTGSSGYAAVDAFTAARSPQQQQPMQQEGDYKEQQQFASPGSMPPPAAPNSSPGALPPPPTSEGEEETKRTRPEGVLGKFWISHSMTSTHDRFTRKNEDFIPPPLESELIRSNRDRDLMHVSLPHPTYTTCVPLNIDLSSRSVLNMQTSILEELTQFGFSDGGLLYIFRSGDYVFGGYTSKIFEAHAPDEDNSEHVVMKTHSGTRDNFLFSMTHDLKIPYNGRVREKKPTGELINQWGQINEHTGVFESFQGNPYKQQGWESFYSEPGILRFGKSDLVLSNDLDHCSSSLESSYGCSFRGALRTTVLAGANTFRIDDVEVFFVQHKQ